MRARGFFRLGFAGKPVPFGGAMVDNGGVATITRGGLAPEGTAATPDRLKSRAEANVRKHDIVILVPCFNEEVTVGKTVAAFREALPSAAVYVYDNNSTDRTVRVAEVAGAIVRNEPRQGKGNVVRRMFADIDADIFVLVDGDATYEAQAAPRMVRRAIEENLDFVNGARVSRSIEAYRRGHRFGNKVLTALVRNIFGRQFTDMLSGYKVFSRRYVKSFPATSRGFEIETELTVHALELRMPCAEEFTVYGERPSGSASKLSTFRTAPESSGSSSIWCATSARCNSSVWRAQSSS